MSVRSRIHRPNRPEEPQPKLLHVCGLCHRAGGTLKRVPSDIVWLKVAGSVTKQKIRFEIPRTEGGYLYVHADTKFCGQYHVPRWMTRAIESMIRRARSRAAQEFHSRGSIRTKRVAFQRRSV